MRIASPLLRRVAFVMAVFGAIPVEVEAQNGADIMARAMEAQAERLSGVNNITVTQNAMGMDMTHFMEKRDVDGVPTLVPVSISVGGQPMPMPSDAGEGDWANPFQKEWADRTQYEGKEVLDGVTVLVLAIDDFSGLETPAPPGGGNQAGEYQPRHMRFWMDKDQLVMRKMEMEAEIARPDGSVAPMHMTMFQEDFREVDGYLHPFVTRVITQGAMGAADMDQDQLRAQLAQMKAQMENIPEAQRAMMERMLGPQIEALEASLGGEGMEMTMTVSKLEVNAGPPGRR